MTTPLRILLVEDSPTDAKLVMVELGKGSYAISFERVEDAIAMRGALEKGGWDLVLCDWSLPRFGARAALKLVQELGLDLPFIIVSGTMGEESAVEAMRAGAHDYVLKDRLARLLPAIDRELRESKIREARHQAERALVESEARYRRLAECGIMGIVRSDANGNIRDANDTFLSIVGYTRDDLQAGMLSGKSLNTPEWETTDALARTQLASTGVAQLWEKELLRKNGSRVAVMTGVARVGTDSGEQVAFILDLTARKQAEAAAREGEARKAAMMETALDAIVGMDAAGNIVEFSRAAEAMFGHSRMEVVGKPLADVLIPPTLREAHRVGLARYLTTGASAVVGKRIELSAIRRDGTEFPIELAIGRVGVEAPPTFTAFIRDISARKAGEDALRVSEARFRRLYDSGIIGILVADTAGNFLDVNDTYASMLGYTRAELLAGGVRWPDVIPPEFSSVTGRAVDQLAAQGFARPWETEAIRKDGSRVSMLVGIATLDASLSIAFTADLSSQKRVEEALRKSDAQFRQAQKMEAVGRLAGGVAHDFNNLLSVILSYGEMILRNLKPDDPIRSDIEEIHAAGQRAAELTRQLLMFSRRQVLEPRVLDLNDVLVGMDRMLQRILGEDIHLESRAAQDIGKIKADPSSIEQVIMNLVVNARDAMPTGGRITIETANVEVDEHFAGEHPGLNPGHHVMLAVSDTGVGIDAATQARIFEPFFTTKEKDKGTGLGLSTVFGIAQQSGGGVWVYSEPGRGTSFKVYLPRVDAVLKAATLAPLTVELGGSETILLVEDNDQVRRIAREVLRSNGYDVIVAGHAGEALLICEQHLGTIHLLLTDVVMPQMSGPELARRLATIRPTMKVLFMSGYTDDSVVRHGIMEAEVPLLQKPFTPDTMARRVRAVLNTLTEA